ncbi:MAG: Tol-Pal system beta propeller repeat protein TolB [Deltaproteobacteria bacterium]|nr:Tol-Pal system beta propeller repeat protein TolB [Deltaproteobacteria bacterium]
MKIFSRVLFAAALLLAALTVATPSQARVYIDITQPFSRQLPLAMPAFETMEGGGPGSAGPDGHRILKDCLSFTGMFDFLNPKSFLKVPAPGMIDYRQWAVVGAELLITVNYKQVGNSLSMECRLYDVVDKKLLTGRRYDGVVGDVGAMMSRFADEVMLALTGDRSVFSTMIAFVSANGGKKEIKLMRWDGSGVRQFTHRGDLCLYPAWSSDGTLLAYTAYLKRRPAIFVHALAGGSGQVVVNKTGVNLTPAFRPGRRELAVAMSHTGKTNIFLVSQTGEIIRQLTDGWGIEVDPAWSPDGNKMAFVSDRGGTPQVYVLNLVTNQVTRLTFGTKYAAAPDWSPKGDRLALQVQVDGTFQVATVRPDGGNLQVLTSGYGGGENPSWSPDGRLIAYASRKTGTYQIYVMTSDGRPIRRITNLPGEQTDPAWSPRGVAVK